MNNGKVTMVGDGKVVLLAGGGKVFTDVAARFVRGSRSLKEIVASEYDAKLVKNIIDSGHLAATEFDYFVFGVEGYSRACELHMVRKRIASYLIKSGRVEHNGRRSHDYVFPYEGLLNVKFNYNDQEYTGTDIVNMVDAYYDEALKLGYREEDVRYMKPQATEFKAIIGMNAHALLDWFKIRTCLNAQLEIRDMANKCLRLCKQASPDLFANAGSSCKVLGYCPEGTRQNEICRGVVPTKEEALKLISEHYQR